jgi:alpha-L-rhamnosidase
MIKFKKLIFALNHLVVFAHAALPNVKYNATFFLSRKIIIRAKLFAMARGTFSLLVMIHVLTLPVAGVMFPPINLRCESQTNPAGIDDIQPRLSWWMQSGERCQRQIAYHVLVATSENILQGDEGDLWDSGKVMSGESAHIQYAGKPLISGMKCFWKVRIWNSENKVSPWSRNACWIVGLLNENEWKGSWIGARGGSPSCKRLSLRNGKREEADEIDHADPRAILLRRQMTLEKKPARAIAYICGLGYYEFFINGKRIGNRRLDPAFTDYTKRILYVTYDVSKSVKQGENVLGAILGNGFYNLQTPDLFQLEKAPWRTPPRMLINLVIEFEDGSTTTIVSDDQWKWSTGTIQFNCIRGGETIDARKDPGPWLEAYFNDIAWMPVQEVDPPLGKLSAQTIPPIRISEEFKPRRITEPRPGVYVVDFGRNMAGWVRWTASGANGQKVVLHYGEVLKDDGTLDTIANSSHTYGRYQRQECILSGERQDIFEPRFTYHAFRYVEFHGLNQPPNPDDLTACRLHTQLKHTSSFSCSDFQLNQLHNAARRTLEDCTWGGPTAEPLREKVMWMGDDVFCMDAYFYLFDSESLFSKHIKDIMAAQETNGHFGSVIPTGGWGVILKDSIRESDLIPNCCCDGPWWSIGLPLSLQRLSTDYSNYEILSYGYESSCRYMDFLSSTANEGIVRWGLGDWLPRSGSTETKVELTSTAAYYYYAKLLSNQAARLQKNENAKKYFKLAESIREAFNNRYFDPETGYYDTGSQTSQSLPLVLGLVPMDKRNIVLQKLVEAIRAADNRIATGFIGTLPTLYILTDFGYGDLAFDMVKDGWFHMLENGVESTLGESQYHFGSGHHQFGASIVGWMYRCLAGIRPDTVANGYKEFIIKPTVLKDLTWVNAHYDSSYGRISSFWQQDDDRFTLRVTIPHNTTATVYLPAKESAGITESGQPASKAVGIEFVKMQNDTVIYKICSGTYEFQSILPKIIE